jgi:hypothetical protein
MLVVSNFECCQRQINECILLSNLGVQEMKTSDLNTIVTDSVETCDKKSKRTSDSV